MAFVVRYLHPTLVIGFIAFAISGCDGSSSSLSQAIMTDAQHSHYHVHAVDASHEHTHSDNAEFGGHVHSHQHPE